MKISNSQIRARARHLLDDNILGNDWSKAVIIYFLQYLIVGAFGGLLGYFSNTYIIPYLIVQVGDVSKILLYGIPVFIYLIDVIVVYILAGPLEVGLCSVHLDLVRDNEKVKIRKFFKGFTKFGSNVVLGIMYVMVISLWSLVFIIPGIVAAYTYSMVFYIKNDHPEYNWRMCFDESQRIMSGNKFRLFRLQMSFIGWSFLALIVCPGIGQLWVSAYQQTSTAVFYQKIKQAK